MIIYKSSAYEFDLDVRYNKITQKLEDEFVRILGRKVGESERRAFQNSLSKMNEVLINEGLVKQDCGVLIEYQLPSSSMRIDFMITGKDKFANKNAVIVELKQWESVEASETEHQVFTHTGGTGRDVNHPAVQVHNYKQYLEDYHTAFHKDVQEAVKLYACSYLHNYRVKKVDKLLDLKFKSYIDECPVFTQEDTRHLGAFIRSNVEKGDGLEILDYIEAAIPKPSKKLIEHINNIIDEKSEFILMDQQLVVFDRVMHLVKNHQLDGSDGHFVVLVKGGPGTGKSVVGLNLLSKILTSDKECIYLAANAAFKNGMANRLDKDRAKRLFKHPYYYNKDLEIAQNTYQTAIIDEAHRISSTPPPMQKKLDDSLIDNIIQKTALTVFFSDDNQMIRPNDIGSYSHIKEMAAKHGCTLFEYELDAQFRCAGSEGYLNWLDDVLRIRDTANASGWENMDDMQFKIFDNPNQMRDEILKLQTRGLSSRLVAGYAWEWSKDLDENGDLIHDVCIHENNELIFSMPWNPQETYKTRRGKNIPRNGADWAINPVGVNQIGCIHTCQGLEFDYVGVIIGKEFTYNLQKEMWEADVDQCFDAKIGKNNQDAFLQLAQNTYRTLMTRGMKGVFVYAVDADTRTYLKRRLNTVRKLEDERFYHNKKVQLHELFDQVKEIAAEELNIYPAPVYRLKLEKFNISKIQDKLFYCDIQEETVFYEEIKRYLKLEKKDIDSDVLAFLKDAPQIRYYSEGLKGLKIETDLFSFEPEAFVKRNVGDRGVLTVVFRG